MIVVVFKPNLSVADLDILDSIIFLSSTVGGVLVPKALAIRSLSMSVRPLLWPLFMYQPIPAKISTKTKSRMVIVMIIFLEMEPAEASFETSGAGA